MGCLIGAGAAGGLAAYGASSGDDGDGHYSIEGAVGATVFGGATAGLGYGVGRFAGRLLGSAAGEATDSLAANAGARMPGVIRAGELKLPGVPKGATGTVTKNGEGLTYAIPRGTPELDSRVTQIRIMNPTTGKYAYPNGYAVYMNAAEQRVNPLTGQMIHDLSDPFAHIPLS